MHTIEPFDSSSNPLRGIREDPHSLSEYVQEHALNRTARMVWTNSSKEARVAVLSHLADQCADDWQSERCRFHSLRQVLDGYATKEDFVELVEEAHWHELHGPLEVYLSLYAESQGELGPHFSSQAFVLHYLEAHGTPLAS